MNTTATATATATAERYQFNIRLSKSELEQLKREAAKEMLSLSAYSRRRIFLNPTNK